MRGTKKLDKEFVSDLLWQFIGSVKNDWTVVGLGGIDDGANRVCADCVGFGTGVWWGWAGIDGRGHSRMCRWCWGWLFFWFPRTSRLPWGLCPFTLSQTAIFLSRLCSIRFAIDRLVDRSIDYCFYYYLLVD
jgi:hypothetical protein